ncbi:MAG TPA: hypothetical protein VG894_01280 [Bauldia sp.]|nr:hypothetical protein [Bauldia sp.]
MNNTVIYLIGHSPAARLAVAQAIAAATGARIVDSQALYAPIFNVIDHADPATLPDSVWAEVDAVRGAVLRTIESASPKDWSFVFTHAGFDIPADVGVYRTVRATAHSRSARFVPVTLTGGASKRPLLHFEESDALTVAGDDSARTAAAIVAAATR